jgi:protease-4
MTGRQKLTWMAIGGGVILALVLVGCGVLGVIAASLGATTSTAVVTGPAVAIVRVEGIIVSGKPASTNPFGAGSTSTAYSGVIVDQLRQAEADGNVKVVILRVDSPGGSVVASQEIHQQMLAMTKPVIVSMGEMAASGGYYVSAPAKEIYANPATLTGSIGVISEFINIGDLLDQYGVEVTVVKSGAFKDEGSAFRPMTEEEVAVWQAIIDEAYQGFVQVVADGRKLSLDQVKKLADGRVYTGRQAQALGLVDKLGNLPDAIKRAAELGGIQGEPRIVEYKEPLNLFSSLFNLSRPSDPVGEVLTLLDRGRGPALQYLYVGP